MSRSAKFLVRLVVLALLVAIILALRSAFLGPDPVHVSYFPVERGRVESTVTNSKAGTVKARRRAKLSPGTSGIVTHRNAQRGERVVAGEVLLRIGDETQRAQYDLAQRALEVSDASYSRACVVSERAHRELERNRKLADEAIVTVDLLDALESAYDLAVAERAIAQAEVERGRAAVDVAAAELQKTILRAPFDAIIAEVSVEIGEWVTPSVALLAAPDVIDAIDPGSLYISAPMDEVDAGLLRPESAVRVTIDSYPDRSFPGRVVRVAPYVLDVEQQNRTLEVEVELSDEGFSTTLLPGTSADVEIILEVREDALRIPTSSLLEGLRVLVVADGVLVERAVRLGVRNWDWVEVLEGLDVGDRLVTNLDDAQVRAGVEVRSETPWSGP